MELGGAQQLVDMLGGAKDDSTRKEALNAIVAIARSGLTLFLNLDLPFSCFICCLIICKIETCV